MREYFYNQQSHSLTYSLSPSLGSVIFDGYTCSMDPPHCHVLYVKRPFLYVMFNSTSMLVDI